MNEPIKRDLQTLELALGNLYRYGRATLANGEEGDKWSKIIGAAVESVGYRWRVEVLPGNTVRDLVLLGGVCESCGQVRK